MIDICTIPKDLFKPYFNTVFNIKPDVELHIVEDGLYISTKNSSDTGFINAKLTTPVINQGIVKLSLGALLKFINGDPSEDVKLQLNGNQIIFKSSATYRLTTLSDPLIKHLEIPPPIQIPTYTSSITVSKDDIIKMVNDVIKKLDDPSEFINFNLTDTELIVSAKVGENFIEFPLNGSIEGINANVKLPHGELKDIFSNIKSFNNFKIYMNTNYPCRIDMSNTDNTIVMIGIIAPRIEDD